MPAIRSHETETVDRPWDAAENERRLRSGEDPEYYARAYAWRDPDADPTTKSAYKFIHHEVSADGEPGAANVRGCIAGIAVLNGGRGGADIPDEDREGVYNHLARHLRDAGREPPELQRSRQDEFVRFGQQLAEPSSLDRDNRRVNVVAYSGQPVTRLDPWTGEIYSLRLSLEPSSARLERAPGAPVLDGHNADRALDQIGVVERIWVEDGRLLAQLRFSDRSDVEPIWHDIASGIIRNVSIGALIYKREKEGQNGYVATDWELLEISVVPIPADSRATVLSHAAAQHTSEEEEMPDNITASAPHDVKDIDILRAQWLETQKQIRQAARRAGLDEQFADRLCESCSTVEQAKLQIYEELARRYETSPTRSQVAVIADEADKRREGMAAVLLHQIRPQRFSDDPQNPWRGMRLSRIAEECARLAGKPRPIGPNQLVEFALSTSDFPYVLANVANKTLLESYQYAAPTYRLWTRGTTLPDFKTVDRVRLSEFPTFTLTPEGQPIQYGNLSESREQYRLATYGRGLTISREMIINDDLGAIERMFGELGVKAALLENLTVYSILNSNPTMGDGVALFHASHANLAASGAAIGVDTVGAGRAAMMTQKGLDGVTPLNVIPRFLIVPAALATKADAFVTATTVVYTKQADVNPFAGRLTVVADAALDGTSATAWYLAADPMLVPTIEYAYLEGAQGPQTRLEENTGGVLGVRIWAWLDFAAKAIDWRGLYKNPGA